MSDKIFCGLHVGHSSLYGVALSTRGEVLKESDVRFREPSQLPEAYDQVTEAISSSIKSQDAIWTLGLEKVHRPTLAPRRREIPGPELRAQIVQPALASVLLGAIPDRPGLLLSMGREVRIALIDSTLTYREYRFTEGGGSWWQLELTRLAEHSVRLQTHLKSFKDGKPTLKHLPQLLELGQFPTPDPVLKPRLEKMAERLAQMALRACARLPGLEHYSLSGFLGRSSFGDLVAQYLNELAPQLRRRTPKFPPEIGSALLSLAQDRENWEREHLGKPLFSQDQTVDEWTPPRELIRRLYRLRKPFEGYVECRSPGG